MKYWTLYTLNGHRYCYIAYGEVLIDHNSDQTKKHGYENLLEKTVLYKSELMYKM